MTILLFNLDLVPGSHFDSSSLRFTIWSIRFRRSHHATVERACAPITSPFGGGSSATASWQNAPNRIAWLIGQWADRYLEERTLRTAALGIGARPLSSAKRNSLPRCWCEIATQEFASALELSNFQRGDRCHLIVTGITWSQIGPSPGLFQFSAKESLVLH
jgi:hypothetical protein